MESLMSPLFRTTLIAGALALGGCATTDAGLASAHQPLISEVGATVAGCPDWSDSKRPVQERQASNYGCASATNLAAMIADPMDLVRGKSADGSRSGETAAGAIKSLRSAEPSGKGNAVQQVSSRSQ
jgi:pilus assembly protein CpaD